MLVGALVAFVVLAIGTFFNYLITIRSTEKSVVYDKVQTSQSTSTVTNFHPYTGKSMSNNSEPYFSIFRIPNNGYELKNMWLLLPVISFVFIFATALTLVILTCFCKSRSSPIPRRIGKDNVTKGFPIPVIVYESVTTQVSIDIGDNS